MTKRKIGTIKITRKITTTHRVTARQNVQQHYHQEVQALQNNSHNIQTSIRSSVLPKLPTGIYAPQVETLYEELYKRKKDEETSQNMMYDVFISHASEDKPGFVDPLVTELQNAGIRVWYDSLEMQWGKSLREQIDNGIKRSKFAILVLSKNFFAKQWPKRELDGILAKETVTGVTPLPIWHEIKYEEVYEYSPTLAGLYSLSTDKVSIQDICKSFKLILDKGEQGKYE